MEVYYRKRHQEQLKALLQQLAVEEQAAASRMIEKHSNEMLQLIEEKVVKYFVICQVVYISQELWKKSALFRQ